MAFGNPPKPALNDNCRAIIGLFNHARPAFFKAIRLGLKPVGQIDSSLGIVQHRRIDQASNGRLFNHIAITKLTTNRFNKPACRHRQIGNINKIGTSHLIAVSSDQNRIFQASIHQINIKIALVFQINFRLTALGTKQRWLRNVKIAFFNQWPHVAEKESQKQCTDMASVNIRIGHDDDFVIADFFNIHISIANTRTKRSDQGANFNR